MRPRERFKLMNYASSIYKINLTTYLSNGFQFRHLGQGGLDIYQFPADNG